MADAIERRQGDIERRWLVRVREDARAAAVEVTDLKDGVGEYLRRIAETLRDGESSKNLGAEAWRDVGVRARAHADPDRL